MIGGAGTQTAAVIFGGDKRLLETQFFNVEEYNGTGFSNQTAYPLQKSNGSGQAGTQTAGLIFGGGFFHHLHLGNTA